MAPEGWWPSEDGRADEELDVDVHVDVRDPLAETCAHLNFTRSLERDGHEIHRRTVDVFLDVVAVRERTSQAWARSARLAFGPYVDRLRARAEEAEKTLSVTRSRAEELMTHRRTAPDQ
jgi:23S rRNA G2069 N7-methylase RlmK/C1962 C5-methylase RlmI